MTDLKDRVAIVSGGATSIGAAIVRAFVAEGAAAVAADIDSTAGEALAGELGPSCTFISMDLASDDDIDHAVAATLARYGRLDFVVNAAALYLDNGSASPREEWHKSLDVNLAGPVMLARAAHRQLAENRGAIVNVGSISAKVAQSGRWTYPAAKAGLHQVTRSMALDFASDGIRVNTVSPGWTFSSGMEKMGLSEQIVDKVAATFHLTSRAARRDEIANVVVFLCSRQAGFITGADVPVDGGYSALGPEAKPSALENLVKAAAGDAR